jgi:thiol-disulfide isomerase/thioredoxin
MDILLQQDNYKKIIVRGSKTQQQSMELELSKKTLYDNYNSLNKKRSVLEKSAKGNEHELNILLDSIENIRTRVKDKDLFFIKKNPKSFLTLGLLYDYFSLKELTFDSAKNLFDGLDTSIKNSASAHKLKLAFDNRQKNAEGKDAFDFVKFDITGNMVKLSSFRGKNYVLLDFWASWCAPCFEVNPEVIQIFKKYSSSGLIVIGISLDSDEKKWKLSIPKYNNYLWPNFLDVQGPDSNLRTRFDILAIPELVLIDKNGKIVGQYLGQEKNSDLSNLSATLKSVFKK